MSSLTTYGYVGNVSATANVCPRKCDMAGIWVATSGGTIAVYDSATTTTSAVVSAAFTPTAPNFYPIPASLANGCYIVITGAINCTVMFA